MRLRCRDSLRRRVLSFLSSVELRTLAFRKHSDAGAFVRDALTAPATRDGV